MTSTAESATPGSTTRVVSATSDAASVVGLSTEFIDSPLGVETLRPQLSWRIETRRRGMRQSAYQIEVANSAEALIADHADLWDSGRVASDVSIGVRYSGAALISRQRCFWRVRIWAENGTACTVSDVAWWEMGLLDPSDWSGQWLAAEDEIMRDDRATGFGWVRGPAPTRHDTAKFRLRFSVPVPAEAVLFITANGKFDLWIDGDASKSPPADPLTIGLRPTTEISMPLAAGTHVLAVSIDATDPRLEAFCFRGGAIGFPGSEIAPFLRIRLNDGRILRLNNKGWKTALSSTKNWQSLEFADGHWTEAVPAGGPHPEPWPKQTAILLRRAFSISKRVDRARIYATALGAYELHLNGRRVGDALLEPECSDFSKRILYRAYDVTGQIINGENALGAVIGDGWYASFMAAVGRYPWSNAPRCLLAQLELTFADGSREVIASGPGWCTSRAPIGASEIYDGEYYDARLEQPDWSTAGFSASQWRAAEIARAPSVALTAHISPPIRRETTLRARAITQPRTGVFVFDFGQNFAGWCRLKARGPAGTVVEMRFGELLKNNAEVEQANLRLARATDTYILRGDPAGETFEPHFTYHGFRYVQVTGFPGTPMTDNLEGIVIHSDLKFTGKLSIDNALIQQFWHNTQWSQRSNFMGLPTDCPQRDERLGYLGDANVFWDAAAFNMDVAAFTRRFMRDVRDAQSAVGAFADFSPAAFRLVKHKDGMLDILPGWVDANIGVEIGASPGWADAGVTLPWTMWQRYGDTGIIEENWHAMVLYLRFIHDSNPDFIWRNNRGADFGDWLALDSKDPWDATTPKDLVATAMWAHSVSCMAEMAEATGRGEEARKYRAIGAMIACAFQNTFIAADGAVGNDSQTGYILALRYDLVPDGLRAATAAKLAANITKRGTLLSTGFLGTPNSLDVLADAGYSELVYSLLLRTDRPSWGHMIARGATTIWESWNGDSSDVAVGSLNHYALGAVCGFLFRRIAGIAPLEPGFRKIEVRPVLDPRVKRGGGEYESVLGKISTQWEQRDGGRFSLELTVPPNSTAMVYLPATQRMTVTEGGQALSDIRDSSEIRRTSDQAIVEVGSGIYRFEVS